MSKERKEIEEKKKEKTTKKTGNNAVKKKGESVEVPACQSRFRLHFSCEN